MKTNNSRKTRRIIELLLLLALLVPMLACGDSQKTTTVNRPAPTDTLTEEKPKKDDVDSTPKNPSEAFAGVWETQDTRAASASAAGTAFVRWQISKGINKDGEYVGKVTDLSNNNEDVADYVLRDDSVTLEFKPGYGTGSNTYPYEISKDGNTITLKGDKPIILIKGSTNADMLRDAELISDPSKPDWFLDSGSANNLFGTPSASVVFTQPTKYKEGYIGKMEFNGGSPVWDYTITARNKIEIKDGTGTKEASYEIINDDGMRIKFNDGSPDIVLNR